VNQNSPQLPFTDRPRIKDMFRIIMEVRNATVHTGFSDCALFNMKEKRKDPDAIRENPVTAKVVR